MQIPIINVKTVCLVFVLISTNSDHIPISLDDKSKTLIWSDVSNVWIAFNFPLS